MSVIVTDTGFAPTTWTASIVALADLTDQTRAVDLVEHRRPRRRCRTVWPT